MRLRKSVGVETRITNPAARGSIVIFENTDRQRLIEPDITLRIRSVEKKICSNYDKYILRRCFRHVSHYFLLVLKGNGVIRRERESE